MTAGQGQVLAASVVRWHCPAAGGAVASGVTAQALTELFTQLRDELVRTPDTGGVLVLVRTDEASPDGTVVAAVSALVRSLTREFAVRRCRVNAVVVGAHEPRAMQEFLAGPAAALLTGAVFDAR